MANVLLGCAIGDSLGVFAETKQSDDPLITNWDGQTFLGSEHHGLKPGNFSDDTQLSQIIAESLIKHKRFNPDDVSERYIEWIVSKRARGIGGTCLKAIQNLMAGVHWSESGVIGSYGNGTAMRTSPFGVFFRKDLKSLLEAVKVDSAITHNSNEAEAGALAIALTAYYAANNDVQDLTTKLSEHLPESKVKDMILSLNDLVASSFITPMQALEKIGTKGDVRQTVPAALYCFLKFDNYQEGCETIIRSGGDTDTNSAILAALYGAQYGMKHFSEYHIRHVEDSNKLIQLDIQLGKE